MTPADEGFDVELRDGTRAHLRPIRADDKERLQTGLQQLSSRSRYLRFHTPMSHFTQAQLRYLTEIDYHDHMAWVAVNPDDPDEPGMGVARYVRLAEDPTIAEAAVTVLDQYQGNGLGTLLLQTLTTSAVDNGVRTFRNYVLAENRPMLEVFEHLGGVRVSEGGSVDRVDVELPGAAELTETIGEPPAARHVLRTAARRARPLFHWVFPWMAPEDESGADTGATEAG